MPLQDSDIFLVTKADGSESRHIRADKLFSGIADDWFVVIQEGTQSKRCLVSALPDKASDTRYMLVNRDETSYKIKSSTVVDTYTEDFSEPLAPFTHYQLYGSAAIIKNAGGTSSSTGAGVIFASVNSGNSPGDPYYGINTLDYWYGLVWSRWLGSNNNLTANMTGNGKSFEAVVNTGISGDGWTLYRSGDKVKRTDISSDDQGAYYTYQSESYPHSNDDSTKFGYFCCGWMMIGNHQYTDTSKTWSKNVADSYQISFFRANQGSDEVIGKINVNNGANESTQWIAIAPNVQKNSSSITYNPAPAFGGCDVLPSKGVNASLMVHGETAIGQTGDIDIKLKGTSAFNEGTPDLLICRWRVQYT